VCRSTGGSTGEKINKVRRKAIHIADPPIVESLEDRVLFSADILAGLLPVVPEIEAAYPASSILPNTGTSGLTGKTDGLVTPETSTISVKGSAPPPGHHSNQGDQQRADDTRFFDPLDITSLEPAASGPKQLIVIDSGIDNADQLIDDLRQNKGVNAEVLLLDKAQDGIEQISKTLLTEGRKISGLHIISHGDKGEIRLGNTVLTTSGLHQFANQIESWKQGLANDADILLYGCELAGNESGENLVDAIGALTNASVAASDDLTGHKDLGGDWDFEYFFGTVETDVAFSRTIQSTYMGTFSTDQWFDRATGIPIANPNSTDNIYVGDASDNVPGNAAQGDDVLYGHAGNDILDGGLGNDIILGGTGNDILTGKGDNDILSGGTGDDIIEAGTGNDIVIAGGGDDILEGDGGDDRFLLTGAQAGDVISIHGGNELDTIDLSEFGAANVNEINGSTIEVTVSGGTFTINHNAVEEFIYSAADGNQAPDADAGPDAIVAPGATVELTAADSSDPEGAPLSYQWQQLSGEWVTLTGASTASASFTAPLTLGELVFAVTVSDGVSSDIDIVTIQSANISAPTNLSSGIDLNAGEGDDAYLLSRSGLSQDLTETTVEIRFQADQAQNGSEPTFISYHNGSEDEFSLTIDGPSGGLELDFGSGGNAAVVIATSIDYRATLLDGSVHTLSTTWDNANGDWAVYIDGEFIESGAGFQTGETLDTTTGRFSFGQEQDGIDSGYDFNQRFSGTIYDVRIWNEARSAAEIALGHQSTADPSNPPDGLIANWQLDGFTSAEVVDIISGNNLTAENVTGEFGYTSGGVAVDSLTVDENSANGTSVGFVVASSPIIQNDVLSDGNFLQVSPTPIAEMTFTAGQTIGDWTIDSGSVDLLPHSFFPGPNGSHVLDLSGDTAGTVAGTTFATEVGKTYQVRFAVDGNFSGGDTTSKDFRVLVAGTSNDMTIEHVGADWVNGYWEYRVVEFTAAGTSTSLSFESLETNAFGALLADVSVTEVPEPVSTVLNNDSSLVYNAATNKFYKTLATPQVLADALASATNEKINGVPGRLVTIGDHSENQFIANIITASGFINVHLGASDAAVEGEWRWTHTGEQFSDVSGASVDGAFVSWNSGEPDDSGNEDFAEIHADGTWNDSIATALRSSIVEWDASDVLASATYNLNDSAGGRFDIDPNTGEIMVADGTRLNYEANPTHDITVAVTNAAGESHDEVLTIAINNLNESPTFETGGTNTLDANPTFVEDGPPVLLDADVQIFDEELTSIDDFDGTSITISRVGSANADDVFSATGTVAPLTDGGDIIITFGLVNFDIGNVTNSGGELTLDFVVPDNALGGLVDQNDIVNQVLQSITYSNSSNTPPSSVDLEWTFDDGNTGEQGTGGAGSVTATTSVNILPSSNVDPVISNFFGDTLNYTTGQGAVVIDQGGNALISDTDSTNFDGGTLTAGFGSGDLPEDKLSIRHQGNGAGQIGVSGNLISFGGTDVATFNAGTGGGGIDMLVSFNANVTPMVATQILQNITYENTNPNDPSPGIFAVNVIVTDGDGGTSGTGSATINVSVVPNTAPVLDASGLPTFTPITEDSFNNSGMTVTALLATAGNPITDANADPEGIAVTFANEIDGKFEYSLDGGTNWIDVGPVSDDQALLLEGSSLIRFQPDGQNGGLHGLNFRAWDQTTGAAGDKVDTTTSGGTTAFSTVIESALLTVSSVNDAPVLDNTGTMTLTDINEDDINSAGNRIFEIRDSAGGDRITDVDSLSTEGIALIAADTSNGTWQFKTLPASAWVDVDNVSTGNALLLSPTSLLRFLPNENYNGPSGNIEFHAWDRTTVEVAGDYADIAATGGSTAFSTATETASLIVLSVNDEPGFTNTSQIVNFIQSSAPIILEPSITVSDAELTPTDNFAGAQLQLKRLTGADADDVFSATGLLDPITEGSNVVYNGATVGTAVVASGGELLITFNGSATNAIVDGVIQSIAWSSPTALPGTTIDIEAVFNDGNVIAQGSGGAESVRGLISIGIVSAPVTQASLDVDENSLTGTSVGFIAADQSLAAAAILANDSSLVYNEVTGKFYRHVPTLEQFSTALSQATATDLNGVSGQLLTIRSAYEHLFIYDLTGGGHWLGASDTTTEGEWRWLDGHVDGNQFWSGAAAGTATGESFTAWAPNEPNNATNPLAAGEDAAAINVEGEWYDWSDFANHELGYVIEWDAADVLSDVDFALVDDAVGRFAINGTTGEITVAGSAGLNFEANSSHSVTAEMTYTGLGSYTRSATIDVNDINDSPAVATGTGVVDEGDVVTLTTSMITATDQDLADGPGALTYTVSNLVNGQVEMSGSPGIAISGFSEAQLDAGQIVFQHNESEAATASFDYSLADGGEDGVSPVTGTLSLSVNQINDAPVLDNSGSMSLTTINEGAINNSGSTVAEIIASAGGDRITDVDPGAIEGIAVFNSDSTNGNWQYSPDGNTWEELDSASSIAARLLSTDSLIRFIPSANYNGTASISFNAWDQSSGTDGDSIVLASGGTSLSAEIESATVTVSAVNDPPTTGTASGSGSEDAHLIVLQVSGNDNDGTITDFRLNSLPTNGTLYLDFSLTNEVASGVDYAATGEALRMYFDPDPDWNGTTTFEVTARDDQGAFDTTPAIATININPVNDAPVIENPVLLLASITEDDDNPIGQSVADILASNGGGTLSDVDAGSLEGIAVVSVDDTGGHWQYSIDNGNNWNSFGAVSITQSLLLDPSAKIRFLPSADFNGTAGSIIFHGWDQTDGLTSGDIVDTTGNTGGTNAFSTSQATATLSVLAANDAPSLTSNGLDIAENSPGNVITSAMLTGVDIDDAPTELTFRITGNVSDGGLIRNNGTPVLLDVNDTFIMQDIIDGTISYSHNGAENTTDSFDLELFDGGEDGAIVQTGTFTINVSNINDAPIYDVSGTTTLTDINEDDAASTGDTVSNIIASATGNRISDNDSGAVEGIAIVAADTTNGIWQYKVFGSNPWTDLDPVSTGNALLLNPSSWLRFVPNNNYNGPSGDIQLKAWDRTTLEVAGDYVTISASGGTSAFSGATEIAALNVDSVNDAPLLNNTGNTNLSSIDEDDTGSAGTAIADIIASAGVDSITDVDAGAVEGVGIYAADNTNGSWEYSIDGGSDWQGIGNPTSAAALLLSDSALVRFIPNLNYHGTAQFSYVAWDQTSGTEGGSVALPGNQGGTGSLSLETDTATILISPVNDTPIGVPFITGLPIEGQVLTADTSGISDDDGPGIFAFQWIRDGIAITGSTSRTFLLGDADVDSTIAVQVSYTDAQGTVEGALTSTPVGPVSNINNSPIGIPIITGLPIEDQVLTADTSSISDDDGTGIFTYQWTRDDIAITGASSSAYVLGDADVGSTIALQVSYTDAQGTVEGALTSTPSGPVSNVNDSPIGIPGITGLPIEDQVLTADTSGISDDDGTGIFTYQWIRAGIEITGETSSTYALGDSDVGSTITLQVSYTDAQGTNEGPLNSTPVGPIDNVNDEPAGADKSVTTKEDTVLVFSASDFGFSDPLDNHEFHSIIIAAIPPAGELSINGSEVSVGQSITVTDINSGLFTYNPPPDAAGAGYEGFSFFVRDNGETRNAGIDTDQTENHISFDLQGINDAPLIVTESKSVDEGDSSVIGIDVLTAIDADDSEPEELTFTVLTLPQHGQLILGGEVVTSGTSFSLLNIQQNQLRYTHDGSETSTDSFDIQVSDGGEDGVTPLSGRLTLIIKEVIDPPPIISDETLRLEFGQSFNSQNSGAILNSGEVTLAAQQLFDNPKLTVSLVTPPAFGTLTLNSDGTFDYQHNGGLQLQDSFEFQVTNEDGVSTLAKVSITIEPPFQAGTEATTSSPAEVENRIVDSPPLSEGLNEIVQAPQPQTGELTGTPLAAKEAIVGDSDQFVIADTLLQQQQKQQQVNYVFEQITFVQHNSITAADNEIDQYLPGFTGLEIVQEPVFKNSKLDNTKFLDGLRQLDNDLNTANESSEQSYKLALETAFGFSVSVTTGIIAWALRGGALLSSFLASTPLWKSIDPVFVMTGEHKKHQSDTDEVEEYFSDNT